MTEKLREAAQQALEALKESREYVAVYTNGQWQRVERDCQTAITTLRAALAEPEPVQEPIEYQHRSRPPWETVWGGWFKCSKADAERYVKSPRIDDYFHEVRELYTAPPQRPPLTDEEIEHLSRTMVGGNKSVQWLARIIERKVRGEKE